MPKVTYICLFNNKSQLESLLTPSIDLLRAKHRSCELILVDCLREGYRSAAEAFNQTIKKKWNSLGDVVCFVHQDIRFDETDFHDRVCSELESNPFQLLGVAGVRDGETTSSNLKYYEDDSYITELHLSTKDKLEVESLDECCFATSKELLSKVRFDEYVCFHWHLYAVEFCYAAKVLYDYPSYVLPEQVYHKLNNKDGLYRDKFFLQSMWRLLNKYNEKLDHICAPCYFHLSTGFIGRFRVLITYIHHLYFIR